MTLVRPKLDRRKREESGRELRHDERVTEMVPPEAEIVAMLNGDDGCETASQKAVNTENNQHTQVVGTEAHK